ncbi:LysE family transporter [Haloferula sargassicola]|uniref:Carbohydrate-binding domain-containing protein n=1 Tax=Haloferula sargassicola TaxID=490096 RepID=A0ABP9UKR1_9BACT
MSPLLELAAFAGIMAVGQFSPGPDLILVTRTALSEGARRGMGTALGIATGLMVHAGIAVAGVAVVLRSHPLLARGIAWLGAAYLAWIAWKLVKHAGELPELSTTRSRHAAYVRGLLCNLLNPKVALIFAAMITPFLAVRSEAWWPWLLWGETILQGLVLWCLWSLALQWSPAKSLYRRSAKWIDRVFAVLLGALAVSLAIGGFGGSELAKASAVVEGSSPMTKDHWDVSQRRAYACPKLGEGGWEAVPWSEDFVDITGLPELRPGFRTRLKMAWDDRYLHVRAEMEEPHVWGTITRKNEVIFHDNDFEIFIDPDGDGLNYYEFEMNALGTIWELSLPKPYWQGGEPILGCNIEGLLAEAVIDGTLNDPSDEDRGWEARVSIPWEGLAPYRGGKAGPPEPGETWRVNFSRVQWRHEIVDGNYVRIPPHGTDLGASLSPEEQQHPEDNWVWSPQGVVNMHRPERWGEVTFE